LAQQNALSSLTKAARVAGLTAKRTALLAAVVKLFKSSFTPNESSVVADFDAAEADYVGYAAETAVWSPVGFDSSGEPLIISNSLNFQCTTDTADNTIGGMWMEIAAGDLYEYWIFPVPVSMEIALNMLNVVVTGTYPDNDDADIDY